MRRSIANVGVAVLLGAGAVCRAEAQSRVDACSLLTLAEVEAAAGWKPVKADAATHGSTATCTYSGTNPLESIAVVVTPRMPKVATSVEMAAWRKQQMERHKDLTFVIAPVEGVGAPAISSQLEGADTPTLEVATKGVTLGITSSTLGLSKSLAAKAVPRLP